MSEKTKLQATAADDDYSMEAVPEKRERDSAACFL